MDYKDYLLRGNKDNLHFWYKSRKELINYLCELVFLNKTNGLILDIGSGLGEELEILKKFGKTVALDSNSLVEKFIKEKGVDFIKADFETYEAKKNKYDCVCCFDVLEHLENDQNALRKVFASLKSGGYFIFTVPAYGFLFSPHDSAMGHFRRYGKKEICGKITNAGFKLVKIGFWNSLLFPLIFAFRFLNIAFFKLRKTKIAHSDAKPLNKIINNFFLTILNLENTLIKKGCSIPFGLTIFGIAKK